MRYTVKIIPLVLLASLAAAQTKTTNPAEIQNLNVLRSGNRVNIEITLTQPVRPIVTLAQHPDRLVVDLPNISSSAKQERRAVDQGGVKAVRIGLNSSDPLVTRMVIELEGLHPYGVNTEGNKLILSILPGEEVADRGPRRGAPVPAASGSLFGRLHRNPQPKIAREETVDAPQPVVPPPALPPLRLPDGQNSASANRTAVNTRPSAAHPNYGSLQQGTVFPNAGSPGAGTVPPVSMAGVSAAPMNPPPSPSSTTNDTSRSAVFPQSVTVAIAPPPQGPPSRNPVPAISNNSGAGQTGLENAAPATSAATARTANGNSEASVPGQNSPATRVSANDSVRPVQSPPASVSSAAAPKPSVPSTSPLQPQTPLTEKITPALSQAIAATNPGASVPAKAASADASAPLPVMPSATPAGTGGITTSSPDANASSAPDASIPFLATRQPNSDVRMSFKVKYVAEGAAYLDGGRSAGLSEGMKLEVRDTNAASGQSPSQPGQDVIAELEVLSVAETSAVTEIRVPKRDVVPGDYAFLSSLDTETLVAQRSLSATRKYPTVISFTDGDPLDEEAREEVPRPPLPEINRARGRIGFDYSSVVSHGAFSSTSSSTGIVLRTDITRIGGTYWNLNGYWRGRLTHSSSSGQQTLQDLINRTYTLGLTYDNPRSAWVAGFGRLYLPYATSLDTIDGGYFGRRVSTVATVGIFAGSTPDPASWSYNPNQEIGGTFVNFQGGSFDSTRYTSTTGVGVSMLHWKINRPFVFFENGIYYKRLFSVYSAVQADRPSGNPAVAAPGAGVSRSFTTVRLQPWDRLELDFNHTYFRDIPTFDPTLIGTGLLDKYLFQGFSAGPRVEVYRDIWVYTSLGRSSRTGDNKASWNQMYGVTVGHVPWTRVRADVHYSKFDSSFGAGKYTALSLSRNFKETFRWELLAGIQSYASSIATSNKSHFVTGLLEAPLGQHFFLQSGYTWNRGGTQNYDQYLFSIGYRFDSKYKSAGQ